MRDLPTPMQKFRECRYYHLPYKCVCVINLFLISQHIIMVACTDPESFVRVGPNLITSFLGDERIEDPNTTINGSSSAR